MATVKQVLSAGIRHVLPCNGYFFQLLAASAPISINFRVAGSSQPDQHERIPIGFWYESRQPLTFVEVESTIDQEIEYLYAIGRTGVDHSETITTLSQATVITDSDPETVGIVSDQVLAANPGRRRAIFRADDSNTGMIYLGGAGVTPANAAIILTAGDTYIEDSAAPAEFYAVASMADQVLRLSEA